MAHCLGLIPSEIRNLCRTLVACLFPTQRPSDLQALKFETGARICPGAVPLKRRWPPAHCPRSPLNCRLHAASPHHPGICCLSSRSRGRHAQEQRLEQQGQGRKEGPQPGQGNWQVHGDGGGAGCIRRGGTSEAAPEAVRQAVGGGCQSGWGRLLSVTNSIEAGTCRQGASGWAYIGILEGMGGVTPPFQCIPRKE